MTPLEALLQGHMNARATTAWRMAAGDRRAAQGHLEAMAGQDTLLAEAIRQAGVLAAVKAGIGDYKVMVQTAGRFRTHHPDARKLRRARRKFCPGWHGAGRGFLSYAGSGNFHVQT